MADWSIKELELPLKMNWVIARGSSSKKINLEVTYKSDDHRGVGEIAWGTGEDRQQDLHREFDEFAAGCPKNLTGYEHLRDVLYQLQLSAPVQAGIEMAYLDWSARATGEHLHTLLGVNPPKKIVTSMSLPMMAKEELKGFFDSYKLNRFQALKVKIGGVQDIDYCREIVQYFSGNLRIDANGSFKSVEEVMTFYRELKELPIECLEQPLAEGQWEEHKKIKEGVPWDLIADEDLQTQDVCGDLAQIFDGVNVKLMKAGSILKAQKQMKEARDLDMKVMLGCMVETTLSLSFAILLAEFADFVDLDSFLLLEQDPYGLIGEQGGHLLYRELH